MSIPFTSSEHFKNETMALSRHTKPMKVSALRLAMAKHAGFSSVQAYMTHLDSSDLPGVTSEAVEDVVIDHNCQTFIRREGNTLVFQAKSSLFPYHYDYIDDWNDQVERELIGQSAFGLQDVTSRTIGGENYVSGFVDLRDDEIVDMVPNMIQHFCEHNQNSSWNLPELADQTFRKLVDAFIRATPSGGSPLAEVFANADYRMQPLEPKHFMGVIRETHLYMNELVPFTEVNRKIAQWGFDESEIEDAVRSAVDMGLPESLANDHKNTLILYERTAKMLATMVNLVLEPDPGLYTTAKDFVCGIQENIMSGRTARHKAAVLASFFTNQVYRVDDMDQFSVDQEYEVGQ